MLRVAMKFMRWIIPVFIGLFLACAVSVARAVDPIPESQQAAMALKILGAWHGTNASGPPKKLHVVYFTRSGFAQNQGGDEAAREKIVVASKPVLEAAGVAFERETVLMFCNLAKWDEKAKSFSHHSPYCGSSTLTGGWCFAVDSVIQNA